MPDDLEGNIAGNKDLRRWLRRRPTLQGRSENGGTWEPAYDSGRYLLGIRHRGGLGRTPTAHGAGEKRGTEVGEWR